MVYTTCHIQKDGRITLGTVVHKNRDCAMLKNRTEVFSMEGSIVQNLPKCSFCMGIHKAYGKKEK